MSLSPKVATELLWWIKTTPAAYRPLLHTLHQLLIPMDASLQGWEAVCEHKMALKAHTLVEKRSSRLVGNVDYGYIQGEAKENTASHALVVMVVGLKEKWQYPIAYFLTTSINADIQAYYLS